MATITLRGKEIATIGELPEVGSIAPDFLLVDSALRDKSLEDYKGKKKVLNIVPSLDTSVCAASAMVFNEHAKAYPGTVILTISSDLPFAQKRFCDTEEVKNIVTLSMMRSRKFAKDYGVLVQDGSLAGICARAVLVLDRDNKIVYSELVSEITNEPDYDKALACL